MITDDESFCLESMKVILDLIGVKINQTVDICINGQDQYQKIIEAYENDISYKIIFTDFNMPIMNGIESSKQIRRFLTEKMKIKRSN